VLPQREVVMPAYTCPVVKTAVQIAGKRILYVDISKNSLNATSAEYEQLAQPGRILLPTHLFGIPTDIEAICELARQRGCVTIEDAAASFHSRRNGKLLGTFADFGIFSFERSKRFPSFRGAALVVNNEDIIDPACLSANRVVETKRAMPIHELARALVYNAFTIPWLYGRFTLPQILRGYKRERALQIGGKPNEEAHSPFYTREFHPYQASLVLRMLARLDRIRDHIALLVATYRKAFQHTSILSFLPPECDDSALLRFPIAFSRKQRTDILRLALKQGLYLETNYERALPAETEYAKFPNAVAAARDIVLLPLYTALTPLAAKRLAAQVIEIGESVAA